MKTLIIANGPLVLYMAIKAIEHGLINEDECEILYISKNPLTPDQVIEFVPRRVRFVQFSSDIIGQVKIILYIKFKLSPASHTNIEKVYFANLCSIATNHFAFAVKNVRYFLIVEGIANIYLPSLRDVTSRCGILVKQIFAYTFGLKYRMFDGPISGVDAIKYEGVVSIHSFPATFKGIKTWHLDRNFTSSKVKEKIAVLLDASRVGFINHIMIKRLIENELTKLSRTGYRIFYKNHPGDKREFFLNVEKDKKIFIKYQIEDISSSIPIEMLIEKLNIDTVIGFSSSALVTIRLLFPEVRCISIGTKYLSNSKYIAQFSSIFDQYGVIQVDDENCWATPSPP